MKIGDTVRAKKTSLIGTVTQVIETNLYMVKFPEFGISVKCYASEIALFPNDDTLTGCIAQSYAEAGK